ncbi:MAG: beta-ribofuranosylaminobenzene 5'-phosphate synthase [Candidatus Hydrothermarchaeales archaeon]
MIIETPSRIHMTLIDLNASIGRMDGGLGLALESPNIKITAYKSNKIEVEGPIADKAEAAVAKVLKRLNIDGGIKIQIENAYPQHIGLGSGTQVALGVGKAVCELYDKKLSIREIAETVGRGGTSGIGTAAFEMGGFILDGGHSTREKKDFLPSSASTARPAPILARYDFPDWKVVLVVPRIRKEVHGKKEVNIFQRFCPIDLNEVQELCHLIMMKMLPSILEEDIQSFGESINEIQNTGFKKIEVELQSAEVKGLLHLCQKNSYGAGLSSFGPTIYSIVEDEDELINSLDKQNIEQVIFTKANNKGAIIKGD